MKLTECRCTNCNAPLMIDENVEFYTCEYCDEVIHRELSPEVAGAATGKNLAKKIEKYQNNLSKLDTLKRKRDRLFDEITEKRNEKASMVGHRPSGGISFTAIFIIIEVIAVISTISSGDWEILLYGTIGALLGGYYFSDSNKDEIAEYDNKMRNLDTEIPNLEKQFKTADDELKTLQKEFDINYIPERYRSKDALDYLKDVLDCGRAYSMKEAYNLYEDHQDRVKQRKLQEQSLELQKQNLDLQREKASEETTNSVIDALGTVASVAVGSAIVGKIGKEILKKL